MGKTISDETIKLSIIINGNEAQKEMYDLEKSTRRLNEENRALNLEKKKLEKQNKQDSAEYKALTKSIRENNAELKSNKARMAELRAEIGLLGMTTKQLGAEATRLKLILANLIPGSSDYKKYQADLKAVTNRMDELKVKAQGAKWSIGTIADGFNRYAALGASFLATTTGIVISLQKMIDYNGKLSDAQADVMKTTRMSKKEVDELTKSFGLFQTRTSRIDLLKIAEQGGRVGIAKDEILDFVQVMNKANVALGDSFTGGPEEVAEKLGKIKFLFEETKDLGVEQAYMAIGSAINDLGADGVASERNIAEFTTRIGSMQDVLKPSIAETLALGAAFEESGIEAEVSSRAYNIFLKQATGNVEKFAKVMGLPAAKVKEMINANPMQFMLNFAEGFRGVNMEATDTAQILEYLGINADGANKVIGAMANNTDRFRQLIDLSNNSFRDGTSLINEYNIKNNNLAATLDKIKKKVTGWFSSEGLVEWLEAAVNWFAKFIGAMDDATGKTEGFRLKLVFFIKVLAILLTSIISYNTAIRLTAVFTKTLSSAQTILNAVNGRGKIIADLLRGSYLLLAAAGNFITGNVIRANAAMKLFNTTVKSNPVGLVLSLVAGLTAAFFAFRKGANEATQAQKVLSAATAVDIEMKKELSRTTTDLKSRIDPLIKILKDESTSLQTRKIAYQRLIEIAPEFRDTVDKEFLATEKLTQAYDRLIEKLNQVALAKAREKVRQGRADAVGIAEAAEVDAKLLANEEIELNKAIAKRNEEREKSTFRGAGGSTLLGGGGVRIYEVESKEAQLAYMKAIQNAIDARKAMDDYSNYQQESVKKLEAKLKLVKAGSKEAKAIQDEINAILGVTMNSGNIKTSSYNVPTETEAQKAMKELLKEREKNKEALKKYQDELLELERRGIDDKLSLMPEGFEKERRLEEENHRRRLEELKKRLVDKEDIAALEDKINDPATKKEDVAILTHTKEVWLARNKALNNLIVLEEQRLGKKLDAINLNEDTDRIKKIQESFDREAVLRLTVHNNAMAALGSNERAKQKLQEKFDADEFAYQRQALEKLITEKQLLLTDLQQMDFALLTPEQQLAMQDEIDQLLLKISELLKARAELQGKGGTNDIGEAFKIAFGGTDVLGFTADQWGETFDSLDTLSEKLQAAVMIVGAMQNIWGTYNEYVSANENAQMRKFENNANAKKKKLKWQLDNGYINQSQYQKQLEQLDVDLENKKVAIERKQAKRQKQMAMFNIIANTAQAIMGIWAQFPKADFGVTAAIMSGVVGALGAVQLATVEKTPLPAQGYEEGLYPDEVVREQDGKRFKATYRGRTRSGMVNRPEYFLAGENGPEMVIDAAAYRQMPLETKALLINYLRGVKGVPGYESGKYNTDVTGGQRYEVPSSGTDATAIMLQQAMALIAANTAVLDKIQKEGISAWVDRDYRNIKDLRERLEKEKGSRDKAKQ